MTVEHLLFDRAGIQGKTMLVQGGACSVGPLAVPLAHWPGARVQSLPEITCRIAIFAVTLLALCGSATPAMGASPTIAGMESRTVEVGNGLVMHYWIGGQGAPVVLLHGWPETGYAWRKLAPRLMAAGYRVVVPDLRGFGDSSHPLGGYDRLTMADDVRRLVRDRLRLDPVLLVGHDWGGSIAAAWAGAHPEDVRRLVVIEAQPRGPWSKAEPWFYSLHRPAGFPEAMTAGRERTYLTWFYRNFAARPDAIPAEDIDVYLRSYGSPEGMRAGFELVRALPKDVEANTAAATHPSTVPLLAIGGEKGMSATVAENLEPLFTDVRAALIPGSGHFVPEEAPDALAELVLAFFAQAVPATRPAGSSRP